MTDTAKCPTCHGKLMMLRSGLYRCHTCGVNMNLSQANKSMNAYKIDSLCISVHDYEGSRLCLEDLPDGKKNWLSAAGLLTKAGGESLSEDVQMAFDTMLNKDGIIFNSRKDNDDEDHDLIVSGVDGSIEVVAEYRADKKRKYPPVYRLKMSVDLQEISPEEAEKYWLARVTPPDPDLPKCSECGGSYCGKTCNQE